MKHKSSDLTCARHVFTAMAATADDLELISQGKDLYNENDDKKEKDLGCNMTCKYDFLSLHNTLIKPSQHQSSLILQAATPSTPFLVLHLLCQRYYPPFFCYIGSLLFGEPPPVVSVPCHMLCCRFSFISDAVQSLYHVFGLPIIPLACTSISSAFSQKDSLYNGKKGGEKRNIWHTV